jgi:hypothetical protein
MRCHLFTDRGNITTASDDDLQLLHGVWSWPDQGLSLQPEGDVMEGALGYDLLPYQGKLVVAGGFSYAGGMPANCLAVWDGQAWSTLDGVSPDYIVLALLATGEDLYIGGGFLHVGGINARRVAKWDGESWSGLGNGLNGSVTSLAAWNDGHGSILFASSTWERLAKWDGLAWTQIPGVSGAVTSLEVFDDGSGPALYVAGFFNSPAAKVAKWNGEQWSPLGQGITDPGGYAASLAVYDDGSGPALYMGGEFTEVDGISITNIARWNGQSWSRVGDPHLFPQDVSSIRSECSTMAAGRRCLPAGSFRSGMARCGRATCRSQALRGAWRCTRDQTGG